MKKQKNATSTSVYPMRYRWTDTAWMHRRTNCGKIAYGRHGIILNDLDNLNVEDRHYDRRKTDLENSLKKVYDKIEKIEDLIVEARAKKESVLAEKMSVDNIYKSIIYIDKYFDKMNPEERREFIKLLVDEVNVFDEKTPDGQWLKSIKFKLPLVDKAVDICTDKGTHNETCVWLSKLRIAEHHIEFEVSCEEFGLTKAEAKATYADIRKWVREKYGFNVTNLNIAKVKQKHGIIERANYNHPKSEESRQPGCPEEKVKAIEEAMRCFRMI